MGEYEKQTSVFERGFHPGEIDAEFGNKVLYT